MKNKFFALGTNFYYSLFNNEQFAPQTTKTNICLFVI